MKKTKSKNGSIYYFGNNGKRISAKEYTRRKKISSALKSSWKTKRVLIPRTGEEFTASQKTFKARTKYTDSPLEIADQLLSVKERIKKELRSQLKKGDGLSIGYNFKFQFDPEVYEDNIISQRGFTNRILVGENINLEKNLDIIAEEITARFDIYMSRKFCLGVKLDSLILEKTNHESGEKEIINGKEITFERVTKKLSKKKRKKVGRK